MNTQKIKSFKVEIVPSTIDCKQLNQQNAETFYTAEYYSAPLLKQVVSDFESALKTVSGLETTLLETETRTVNAGSIQFNVKAIPTSNPSYMKVADSIDHYLTDLQNANQQSIRRDNVRKFRDGSYVKIDEVSDKLNEFIAESRNSNVRYEITMQNQRQLPDIDMLIIEPGTYRDVSVQSALTYVFAKEQLKLLGSKVVTPFKKALKQETGFNDKNLPGEVHVDSFGIGKYVFMVTSVPKPETKYGESAKQFIDYVNEAMQNPSMTRQKNGRNYIAIDTLAMVYRSFVAQNTRASMEQRVDVLPVPKADFVLVGK